MCRQPDKENTILTCSFGVAVVSEGWTECVSLGGYVFRTVMGDTSVGDPHSHIWAGGRQITHAMLVASSLNNNAIFEIPQGINKTFSSHTNCGGYSPLHTIMQCMLLQPPSVCTHIWVIAFSFCCYIPAGRLLVIRSSIFLFGRWWRGAELQEALKYMRYLCLRLVRDCLKYLNCAKVTSTCTDCYSHNALISTVHCRRSYPLERIAVPKPLGFTAITVQLILSFSCYYIDIILNKRGIISDTLDFTVAQLTLML